MRQIYQLAARGTRMADAAAAAAAAAAALPVAPGAITAGQPASAPGCQGSQAEADLAAEAAGHNWPLEYERIVEQVMDEVQADGGLAQSLWGTQADGVQAAWSLGSMPSLL